MPNQPTFYLVLGCNGAGKSTMIEEGMLLPAGVPIMDPDAMAKQLQATNLRVQRSPKLLFTVLRQKARGLADQYIASKRSFGVETTEIDKTVSRFLSTTKSAGYRTEIHFISLDGWQDHQGRVEARAKRGGHYVPVDIIKYRFEAVQHDLEIWGQRVDVVSAYSNQRGRFFMVAKMEQGIVKEALKQVPPWAKDLQDRAQTLITSFDDLDR